MERDTNQMSQSSSLCRSSCGFYGSPATDGLCSKCYKDALKRKQSTPPSNITGHNSSGTNDTLLNTAVPTVIAPPSNPDPVTTDNVKSEEKSEASTSGTSATVNPDATEIIGAESASNQDEDSQQKDTKKIKNRCTMCRKKVGLTGFECRCGGLFCSAHRYSDEHNCTFDYKEMGAQEIRKNNPVVIGKKVQKI